MHLILCLKQKKLFALQLREHNHKHKTIVSFNALLLPSTEGWWWMMTVWIGRTSHPIFKSVVTFFLLLSLQIVFGIPTNNCVLCRLPPLFSQMAHIVDVKSFVFTSRKRSFAHNSCCCSCFCCDSRQKETKIRGLLYFSTHIDEVVFVEEGDACLLFVPQNDNNN